MSRFGANVSFEEIKKLLEVSANDELHLIILLTAYYGLRRSEVPGLKWSAIDFTKKTICIRHKVVEEDVGIVGYFSITFGNFEEI